METDTTERPCHLCGRPRGVSHVDPTNHPGKLLCAWCAGATENAAAAKEKQLTLKLFSMFRAAIGAEGGFERRQALVQVDTLLKELQ